MRANTGIVSSFKAASLWFMRGFRRGDWLWLWLAVVVASSSVTLVEQLAHTVHQSMLAKSAESLSADLVIRSSRPIEPTWAKQAQADGLDTSANITLTTMAMFNDQFQMVQLKGIEANYPLRGALQTKQQTSLSQVQSDQILADPQLNGLIDLKLGDTLTLGRKEFKVRDWLSGQDVFQATFSQFAPQVILPLNQLDGLGLIGPGSRVNYELGFSGDPATLARWQKQLENEAQAHWQIINARAPTPDLEKSLDTAWLFLDLSALATVLIAGLAILIASRFYLQRWTASMALMRASGASNLQLTGLFAIQLMLLALIGSVIGVLIGQGLFQLLRPILDNYFDPLVITGYGRAIGLGLLSGTLALWTFAWPAFRQATRVSPLQVLRMGDTRYSATAMLLVSLLLLVGLMWLLLSTQVILWAVPVLLISAALLYGVAQGLLWLISKLQPFSSGWLRLSLAALAREPGLVTLQLISLGLVVFILVLMTFVRQDLLQNWQASLPENTPNTFMMNIQPNQAGSVNQLLQSKQLQADLVPMVRGRLVALNEQTLRIQDQDEGRAQRLLEREANIALLENPPGYNRITQQLSADQRSDLPGVSVEAEIAELLNLKLGDRLTFDLIGQRFSYQLVSLREVEWQSFRLNFFFILEPVADQNLPISYITNFKSDLSKAETAGLRKAINNEVPGVLWIDARDMIGQIQQIMQQASMAVSLLYVFTLVSSLIVIFTATQASQLGRLRSWLLLRTLGARQTDIVKIGLTEFVLIGLLAGVFAAFLGQITSGMIAFFWLDMTPQLNPTLWLISVGMSSLLLLMIGWLTQRRSLKQTPKQLLQQLQADS
ncbi:ABC transporter permease [Thiomicrospira pelophila]|uniref:ABC transporter permease n=1 Tax=Thiomicrospira pelophila TaxID=934 RepID=UPI000690459E|nr:FtsX-like permease family protein [Thiomicrospira pelophila]